MVDTSLSMAGEKMALAAVAAAVLALKLRPGDLAVVSVRRRRPRGLALRRGGGAGGAGPPHARRAVRRRDRHRRRPRRGPRGAAARPRPGAQRPAGERRRVHERRRPAAGGGAVRTAARAPHGGAGLRPATRARRSPPGSRRACTSARRSPAPPTAASSASTASRRCRAACSRSPTGCCDERIARQGGARTGATDDLVRRALAAGASGRRRAAPASGRHRRVGPLEVPLRLRRGGPLPHLPAALTIAAGDSPPPRRATRPSCCSASTSAPNAPSG